MYLIDFFDFVIKFVKSFLDTWLHETSKKALQEATGASEPLGDHGLDSAVQEHGDHHGTYLWGEKPPVKQEKASRFCFRVGVLPPELLSPKPPR